MTAYALDSSAHLPCVVCPGAAEGHPDTPIHQAWAPALRAGELLAE